MRAKKNADKSVIETAGSEIIGFPAPTESFEDCRKELIRLVESVLSGNLDERGDASRFEGPHAELVARINQMLDNLVDPLRLAGRAIDQIAHGVIPEFIIDDRKGEFNDIKRNLNTFLAVMYGMHYETQTLIRAIDQGQIEMRGNDWDFDGNWERLIGGVNGALDAMSRPIKEAERVLERLAGYDLTARITGQYKGGHAKIKKSLNATADALQAALQQVSSAVERVSDSGRRIASQSQVIAEGASQQADSIRQTSQELAQIAESCQNNTRDTREAQQGVQAAKQRAEAAKTAAASLRETMQEIRVSTEGTVPIIQQINEIAEQTDALSVHASAHAARVGTSGRGFAVVASEVKKLANRFGDAAERLSDLSTTWNAFQIEGSQQCSRQLNDIIRDIHEIARQTGFLAINAAVEAAHVSEASAGFETITDSVRSLSQRSKELAIKTEEPIRRAVDMAVQGETASKSIDEGLAHVVTQVLLLNSLADNIVQASQDQARGVDAIRESVLRIEEVTSQSAMSAGESSTVASDLAGETDSLKRLVGRFRLDGAA